MEKIPKIIHYCWFGRGEKTESVNKCIATWEKYLPDYQIIEWNEDNFDIKQNQYVSEAYNEKKWAFVSDYVRLYALYNYGGIYFDTDVEVIKNMDFLLESQNFMGLEDTERLMTAVIGCVKHSKWIFNILSLYDNRSFYNSQNQIDLKTNVEIITTYALSEGINLNIEYPCSSKEVCIYPRDYFSPKSPLTGQIVLTSNTCCIHHFNATWIKESYGKKYFRKFILKLIGEKNYIKISIYKNKIIEKIKFYNSTLKHKKVKVE